MSEQINQDEVVHVTFLGQYEASLTYDTGCGICQTRSAGNFRMLPLPTVKVKMENGADSKEAYVCGGCIHKAVKQGWIKLLNEEPHCPFATE